MSMNLAELGRVICQELDNREQELNTIHLEIQTKLTDDKKELVKLKDIDRTNQQKARTQIREDVSNLLNQCRVERKTIEQVLRDDRISQINEMKTWDNERGEELKGWYKAGEYLLRERTGR